MSAFIKTKLLLSLSFLGVIPVITNNFICINCCTLFISRVWRLFSLKGWMKGNPVVINWHFICLKCWKKSTLNFFLNCWKKSTQAWFFFNHFWSKCLMDSDLSAVKKKFLRCSNKCFTWTLGMNKCTVTNKSRWI